MKSNVGVEIGRLAAGKLASRNAASVELSS